METCAILFKTLIFAFIRSETLKTVTLCVAVTYYAPRILGDLFIKEIEVENVLTQKLFIYDNTVFNFPYGSISFFLFFLF